MRQQTGEIDPVVLSVRLDQFGVYSLGLKGGCRPTAGPMQHPLR